MVLSDLWTYIRAGGDPRLRQQGYASSGMGLLDRFQRSARFWTPHLERNRRLMLQAAPDPSTRGGTLLVLGAGRLLDVPWQELFPRFERVILCDADAGAQPNAEKLFAAAKCSGWPEVSFEIGDCTDAVVQVAAWADHAIQTQPTADAAARALEDGLRQADAPAPGWARKYNDMRMVVSTNLLSQLGHFPRLHVQTAFRKRFKRELRDDARASEELERFFCRVRARHVAALHGCAGSRVFLSGDVEVWTYELQGFDTATAFREPLPEHAGAWLDELGRLRMHWPVCLERGLDPLHDQRLRDLWPRNVPARSTRWAWHIIPQGSEAKYPDFGRIHIVEAWSSI